MNKFQLYHILSYFLAPLLRLYLRIRIRMGKEDAARIGERYGIAGVPRPSGRVVWLHAASVGETQSILPLIDRILAYYPDCHVLLTTGTIASAQMLRGKMHSRLTHQFIPLDHPRWVKSFLEHWRPSLGIWVESELWPNLIALAKKSGVELALINARMSEDSFRNWQKMPSFVQQVLKSFSLVLAQNETYAHYFAALGAPRVEISGNIKFASLPLDVPPEKIDRLQADFGPRKRWLAASTHDPEEKMIGRIHRELRGSYPDLVTILAPRHPPRADKIASDLRAMGLNVAMRSKNERVSPQTDIYLADTIGELGVFFALSKVTFMGGSLLAKGGHNLLEPAKFGNAILHGPHMENFPDIESMMRQASGSILVASEFELSSYVQRLLNDYDFVQSLGARAASVAFSQNQVLDFVFHRLTPFLGPLAEAQGQYAHA